MTLEKINLNHSNTQFDDPKKPEFISSSLKETNSSFVTKVIPFLIIIILGVGTGFIVFNFIKPVSSQTTSSSGISPEISGELKVGETIGIENTDFTPDKTIGVLESGGFDGEGSHRLLRPGGDNKTVYLTSSVVDLDQFIGHKVTVWGQTFSAQKAGWLMDVVRVRVEELNAPTP